ncbi:MAG: BlaI/MecI/CopY family transcriptional regulator [Ruminiclostridium sp.]|jgi:BlaI family penicillinase repressor|nr:BlaI/MecI/CopY family transcriptional regulator [Ruminiclostridium sp.]MCI9467451.1 BlaI/MecI/CopY family transcriptional regulator [Ruminiclostridium sp.]
MKDVETKITDAELAVMQVLWAAQEPLTVNQVKAALDKNGETTKTLLRRLCQKGAVGQEKREVYYYRPLVEQSKLGRYQTQRLIDKLYAGSAKAMVAALVEQGQLQAQDVAELQGMFQDLWEKEDGSS